MRRYAAALLLVMMGSMGGLVIAEAALRVAGFRFVPQGAFFVKDPDVGWVNRPGAKGVWRYEGGAAVEINSRGLRDRERSYAKQPGSFRVAVLGDSFAAAFQVEEKDDFCAVAESTLRDCPALKGRTPEVINFGVSAYGTAQELITLEKRVWSYSPDAVVLAYYPNDLYDNSEELARAYPKYAVQGRPYFHYTKGNVLSDGRAPGRAPRGPSLEKSDSAYGRGFHRILWKFRVWQLVSRVRAGSSAPIEEPFGAQLLSSPADEKWERAWELTEALISRIAVECRERNVPLLLVVISHPLQVYPGSAARRSLLQQAGIDDPFYVNRRLASFAQREGIAFLSLGEEMREYADCHGTFFHGFPGRFLGHGHWNAAGHRFAGERIGEKLCAMLHPSEANAANSRIGAHGPSPASPAGIEAR